LSDFPAGARDVHVETLIIFKIVNYTFAVILLIKIVGSKFH
jgi:hypothetical protein